MTMTGAGGDGTIDAAGAARGEGPGMRMSERSDRETVTVDEIVQRHVEYENTPHGRRVTPASARRIALELRRAERSGRLIPPNMPRSRDASS